MHYKTQDNWKGRLLQWAYGPIQPKLIKITVVWTRWFLALGFQAIASCVKLSEPVMMF